MGGGRRRGRTRCPHNVLVFRTPLLSQIFLFFYPSPFEIQSAVLPIAIVWRYIPTFQDVVTQPSILTRLFSQQCKNYFCRCTPCGPHRAQGWLARQNQTSPHCTTITPRNVRYSGVMFQNIPRHPMQSDFRHVRQVGLQIRAVRLQQFNWNLENTRRSAETYFKNSNANKLVMWSL